MALFLPETLFFLLVSQFRWEEKGGEGGLKGGDKMCISVWSVAQCVALLLISSASLNTLLLS